jgi:hypothetical protein
MVQYVTQKERAILEKYKDLPLAVVEWISNLRESGPKLAPDYIEKKYLNCGIVDSEMFRHTSSTSRYGYVVSEAGKTFLDLRGSGKLKRPKKSIFEKYKDLSDQQIEILSYCKRKEHYTSSLVLNDVNQLVNEGLLAARCVVSTYDGNKKFACSLTKKGKDLVKALEEQQDMKYSKSEMEEKVIQQFKHLSFATIQDLYEIRKASTHNYERTIRYHLNAKDLVSKGLLVSVGTQGYRLSTGAELYLTVLDRKKITDPPKYFTKEEENLLDKVEHVTTRSDAIHFYKSSPISDRDIDTYAEAKMLDMEELIFDIEGVWYPSNTLASYYTLVTSGKTHKPAEIEEEPPLEPVRCTVSLDERKPVEEMNNSDDEKAALLKSFGRNALREATVARNLAKMFISIKRLFEKEQCLDENMLAILELGEDITLTEIADIAMRLNVEVSLVFTPVETPWYEE